MAVQLTEKQFLRAGITAIALLITALVAILGVRQTVLAGPEPPDVTPSSREALWAKIQADRLPPETLAPQGLTPCIAGMAGGYPCDNVDLLAFLPLASIGAGTFEEGNDIWGWTDPMNGKEYAIMGRTDGTAFIDISDPLNPIYLGELLPHSSNSIWRDIKVYANHAFIVSEAGSHGMQVFDLTALRSVASPPVTFSESAHYNGFGNAHNIVINEDSGYAYGVGTNTCSGGLHMVDISTPTTPIGAGCYSGDGYTHDAQCVNYAGPDTDHQGKEICLNANEDTLTIVDVTNKSSPVMLSRTGYAGGGYTHQGWLTGDHSHYLLDDELDELNFGNDTRTFVWDVSNLDLPIVIGIHTGPTPAIDHNQYVHNGFSYQANYRGGLRILDASDVANGNLAESAFFDIYPGSNSPAFNGAWSVYPYFDSGVVIVSGIEQGLFILQPQAGLELAPASQAHAGEPGQIVTHTLTLTNTGALNDTYGLSWSGNSWQTVSPTTTGNLTPGQTFSFDVLVEIPPQPAGGVVIASDSFTLTAQSYADPGVLAQSAGTTHVNIFPGIELSADQTLTGSWGETLNYNFLITNTGSFTDTFSIETTGVWTTSLASSTTPALPPGGSSIISLDVTLPAFPNPSATDITTLIAHSSWDDAIISAATATSRWSFSRYTFPSSPMTKRQAARLRRQTSGSPLGS